MNEILTLKTTVEEIDAQIAQLNSLKLEKTHLIKDLECESNLNKFKSWNVHEGSKVVMFSKLPCGYNLVKVLVIETINIERNHFKVIESDYSDYEHKSLVCAPEFISFSCLNNFEETYNIYEITDKALDELQKAMCSLKIDIVNLSTYEMNIGVKQGRKIS